MRYRTQPAKPSPGHARLFIGRILAYLKVIFLPMRSPNGPLAIAVASGFPLPHVRSSPVSGEGSKPGPLGAAF